jgi:hypothetical protein
MHSTERLNRDKEAIKQAIREARMDGNELEAELLYQDLDELNEEMNFVRNTAILFIP